MKTWAVASVVAIALIVGKGACHAQGSQFVQYGKDFRTRSLSGTVRIRVDGAAIVKARVEDCSPGWKAVLASTTSDENGRFLLNASNQKWHYVRLIAPGFNITLVRVHITQWSLHKTLHLEMSLGT